VSPTTRARSAASSKPTPRTRSTAATPPTSAPGPDLSAVPVVGEDPAVNVQAALRGQVDQALLENLGPAHRDDDVGLELGQLLEKRGRASTSPERAAVQVESRPAACAPPLCRALRHVVNKARPPPPRTTRRLASASRNRKPTWPRPSRIVGRPLPAGAHLRASLPSRGRAKSPLRSHGVCDTNRRHRRRRVRPALDGGRAGLLVPPGDLDALVDAVRRLTSDVELRTALLTRGLELVQELTLEAQAARAAQVIAE
jgi:hypothetical protein